MARTFINNIKYLTGALLLSLTVTNAAFAQTPEIPASVSFGGITVKFDRNAQNLIEEDVKSLMSNKKFWEEKMDRAILHFPIVEGILMDEEVPIDFKYLAVQESSFRPDVISTSNAVGYWQFKPETARELNLRVDDTIDERKNISASTHAAAWYLKKNNQQFNNWVTTLYSYYQGAGGVKKIIPASWAYAREVTLTSKTDRYMLRFFAHKIALEAGIERYKSAGAYVLMESDFGKGKTLDEVASSLGIPAMELKNYNRWLADGKIPSDREYLLTIPVPTAQVAAVREKLSLPPQQTAVASVYEDTGYPVLKRTSPPSQSPALYEINGLKGIEATPGSKPKTLAKAGGMRAPKFMRYNDMQAEMQLIPGKVYYLARKHKKASTPFHTARPGDTWHSVSQQYGLRLVNLLKYNRTTSRNYPIETGQVLFLTKKRPKKQPIEIIAPPQATPPVQKDSVVAVVTEKTPVTAANTIPDKPSGRKKYTPVLVEKTETAAPAETATSEPAASIPVPSVSAAVPSAAVGGSADAAKKPAMQENDERVVIITQDTEDTSFKSVEEERPVAKPGSPSKVITPNETRSTAPSTSVYARQRAAAEERAARERAAGTSSSEVSTSAQTHTVVSGDTYFGIASKYNLSLRELLELNNRSSQTRLSTGQKLIVSKAGQENAAVSETVAAKTTPEKSAPEKIEVTRTAPAETFRTPEEVKEQTRRSVNPESEFHIVEGGQTFYSISKAYGLSVKELLELNNLGNSDRLKSGQRLKVKREAGNPSTDERVNQSINRGARTHTVAAGETLFRIAQTYRTNIEDIKKLNNMSGNSVMVGQKLKIPQQ
ncbi:LysM peptidoglycan-binding domain-containing protein [Dyadobacter sp. CY343]|uniref:LysM peptidoglycan-binding domain-containing protein n=1 Tax=Dyadobacter sp. CY343 TaxID=2907299 RepID=UPI001F30BAB9|nr:LysM peptidoglycan-binding domain-containing protein [Dyadobacter sp. CY343]MCE7061371.1 LysM peptidoglycan-binding domain-containing protein [Dyadobacter sp. CY343]